MSNSNWDEDVASFKSNWDEDVASFKREMRQRGYIPVAVTFDEWPELEKRKFRRAQAWRDWWLALADLPLLGRIAVWEKECKSRAALRAGEAAMAKTLAEALVWQKNLLKP